MQKGGVDSMTAYVHMYVRKICFLPSPQLQTTLHNNKRMRRKFLSGKLGNKCTLLHTRPISDNYIWMNKVILFDPWFAAETCRLSLSPRSVNVQHEYLFAGWTLMKLVELTAT